MAQEPARRTSFSGPALVRLLARLSDTELSEPPQSLSDRLSHWLAWSDAIALGAVLGGTLPASPKAELHDEAQAYDRVHKALSDAIATINAPAPARHRTRKPAAGTAGQLPSVAAVEFSTYRQRYVSLQQTMETRCIELRLRLRAVLAERSPGMARLAAMDAVMEQAMDEREFSLLARVPVLLEAHFKRLRQAAQASLAEQAGPGHTQGAADNTWLKTFHKDMQSVLFAELDIRLQPSQGLLAALVHPS